MIAAVLQVKREEFQYSIRVREMAVVFEEGWELFREEFSVALQSLGQRN